MNPDALITAVDDGGKIVPAHNATCHLVGKTIIVRNIDTGRAYHFRPDEPDWNSLLRYADEDEDA